MRRSALSQSLPPALAATALGLSFALAGPAVAASLDVVASIKPVHSLVASVMDGIGSPALLVKGGGSPHSYSLRPSEAAALDRAAVVVWVGEGMETFLESAIDTLAKDAVVVELSEAEGLTRLAFREGGPWAEHDHGGEEHHEDHAHDHDDDHAHAEDHDHAESHGEEAHDHAHDAGHAHDEEHAHGETDMHLWLDPDNAKAMVAAIAAALTKSDPVNAKAYLANAEATALRLDELAAEIEAELAPVKDRPFVVFHDAFQYFDTRFGLRNVGSVTVNPDRQPGAARLKEIQAKITELGASCVFTEPQFEPRLVQVVIEGTRARTGVLDPLGAEIADGPDLYFDLLRRNADALKSCLSEAS